MFDVEKNIKGLGNALAKLDRVSGKIRKTILEKAFKAGAVIVRDAARANAPKDTGNLKRKIEIVKVRQKNADSPSEYLVGASIEAKGFAYTDLTTTKQRTRYRKGNRPAFYSDFLEKGYFAGKRHFRRGANKENKEAIKQQQHQGHKFIDPKPYLVPAFERVADQAVDKIAEIISEEISKELAGGG